jgi:hypothetical protein
MGSLLHLSVMMLVPAVLLFMLLIALLNESQLLLMDLTVRCGWVLSCCFLILISIPPCLGSRGAVQIQAPDGSVTITNDGATIMKTIEVMHPAAKMLVDLSQAQV